jgi:hypothetical protein
MNKTLLGSVLIIAIAGLIGFYIHSQNTRYYIQSSGSGLVYKIDRKTGRTWVIKGKREFSVKSSEIENSGTSTESEWEMVKILSPEDSAILLAKAPYVAGFSQKESQIRDWLKRKRGELQIIGWKAEKIDDQTYLVSYTFDDGSGERGYFFEVNLFARIVRDVLGDPALEKKYGIEPVKTAEEFLQGIGEKIEP